MGWVAWINSIGFCPVSLSLDLLMMLASLVKESMLMTRIWLVLLAAKETHERLFAPAVDLSQVELNSLDGTNLSRQNALEDGYRGLTDQF